MAPPRPAPGDPIEIRAEDVADLAAALEAARVVAVDGLEMATGPGGSALSLPGDPSIWATLSGSSSPYNFTQAVPRTGGTFAAGARTGTANAYEVNSIASLAGKVVRISPGFGTDWRFYYRVRTIPSTGPTTPYAGCSCATWPTTLQLTFDPSCQVSEAGLFFNDTVSLQTEPAWASTLALSHPVAGKTFLSDNLHTDTFGDQFLFHITCAGGTVALTRIYQSSIFGSPFKDITRESWSLSAAGNTCSPFSLTNGIVYPGGASSCSGSGGTLVASAPPAPTPPAPRRPWFLVAPSPDVATDTPPLPDV